jgi:hypothetical protein
MKQRVPAASIKKEKAVSKSILEAVREGIWDYEPIEMMGREFDATEALPGSMTKLEVLAERIATGQPLWHPSDRLHFSDPEDRG